jgi:uncharacterized protein YutE (UPF0331/DUF86 family)
MAGISNVIGAYNINPKRVSSKLSFEVGQVFAAKIVASSDLNKELVLRLLDGWQFPAKLQNPLEFMPEGLVKFQVDGFQDGKLQIKFVNTKKEQEELKKSSLEDLISEGNIDVSKEDFDILKKMIKHNMPLTKENIAHIKTLVNFREKIVKDGSEAEGFILKYVNNKGIDINSVKGKEISEALKGFFNQLKNVSEDELLTMLESGIEVSEENIKSFTKIVKEDATVYKELKASEKELMSISNIKSEDSSLKEEVSDIQKVLVKDKGLENLRGKPYLISSIIEEELQKDNLSPEERKTYSTIKKLMDNEDGSLNDEALNNKLFGKISPKDIESAPKEVIQAGSDNVKDNIKHKVSKDSDVVKLDKSIIEGQLKEQLLNKTEEMKSIIKNLISEEKGLESENYGKALQTLKENINDFKVFNSLSNQYYYLDVPVNLNRDEYQCKLLIKDDRKSGKKIDSKNVSLVVSVKTTGIGVVDAYIKVREQSMNLDIKCEENWIKMLSVGKNIIVKELSELGYSVFFSVDKREIEANLINCREFFEDNELGSINARV